MRLLIPTETERFEVKRRRQLDAERLRLDAAMESLLADIRIEQMQAGLVSYQQYPVTSMKQRVLELGRSELVNQRNVVLRELASL
jgi:hypothetical protein